MSLFCNYVTSQKLHKNGKILEGKCGTLYGGDKMFSTKKAQENSGEAY